MLNAKMTDNLYVQWKKNHIELLINRVKQMEKTLNSKGKDKDKASKYAILEASLLTGLTDQTKLTELWIEDNDIFI